MHRIDNRPSTYRHRGYQIGAVELGTDRWAVWRPHEDTAFCQVQTLADAREVIEEDEEDNLQRHQKVSARGEGVPTADPAAGEA